MAWLAALGLGGCADGEATRIAKDPYLPTMMKDPLYTWQPAGDLTRKEIVLPKNDNQLAGGTRVSRISIELAYRTSGDASSLLKQAQQVSLDAGYVNGYRRDVAGFGIQSSMHINGSGNGIIILLLAPG
jgi:hypothetical protein